MSPARPFLSSLQPALPCFFKGLLAVRLMASNANPFETAWYMRASNATGSVADPGAAALPTPPPPLRPFHRALATGTASVTETSEGRVSTLLFSNQSTSVLFAMAGELFVGGRQDRVLNRSLVVKPGETVWAPVSCVEASRWRTGRQGPSFAAAGVTACTSVRRSVQESRIHHLMRTGTESSNQTRIWNDISQTLVQTCTAQLNETKTLAGAMYRKKRKLNTYAKRFRPIEKQLGWVLFSPSSSGLRLIGGDAFGCQKLLSQYSRRIFRGAAMEVTPCAPPQYAQALVAMEKASALLNSLLSSDPLETPDPGAPLQPSPATRSRRERHFQAPWGVATILSYAGRPVHLTLSP